MALGGSFDRRSDAGLGREPACSERAGRLQGIEQIADLGQGFLVLKLHERVGYDTAAAPAMDSLAMADQAANGDVEVHLTLAAQVADAAAIQAAAHRLQLLDDLHRADLWGAGDGAPGEGAHQQVNGIAVVA